MCSHVCIFVAKFVKATAQRSTATSISTSLLMYFPSCSMVSKWSKAVELEIHLIWVQWDRFMWIEILSMSGHFIAGCLGVGMASRHTPPAHCADRVALWHKRTAPEIDSPCESNPQCLALEIYSQWRRRKCIEPGASLWNGDKIIVSL